MSPAPMVSTTSTLGTVRVPEDFPETNWIGFGSISNGDVCQLRDPLQEFDTPILVPQPGGRKLAEQMAV